MSYILEALKKAQAERQLGNAPTIHAPQPAQAAEPDAVASRKALFIGLGAGALVVALGALFMWQRGPGPAAPAAPVAAAPAVSVPAAGTPERIAAAPAGAPAAAPAVSAPVIPAPAVPAQPPASPPAAGAGSNTLVVSAPPAPPRPAHPAETPAAGRAGGDPLAAATPRPASRAAAPVPTPAAPAAAPAAPSAEDSLPYLHQLPDAVQRDIPRVSFGGYMYSANPADRLLLVDKALRHEGEEVGPGLVLEKLLPKAAVMNYRGLRYRVAY
jgi:general secretion pathway protein B